MRMRYLLVPLLLLLMFTGGCFTKNVMHDVKHVRTVRRSLAELHKNIDWYFVD